MEFIMGFLFVLFCIIAWFLSMGFFVVLLGTMSQIGEKIDKKVGIKGVGLFSLVIIVFFIIPFVVTVPLWRSGLFKNAFKVEDQGEGLFLVLLPFWVAIGLIVLMCMAIASCHRVWQQVREKEEREQKEQLKGQFRVVRQRIIEKNYPLPGFLQAVHSDIESLKSAEKYEKRMDEAAAKANWFYYDTNEKKICVTSKELKTCSSIAD